MSEAATTLKTIDELIRVGFSDDQAKSVVIAIGEYRDNQLATKQDFARLELKTAEIRTEQEEFKGSVALVDQRVANLESNIAEKFMGLEEKIVGLESRTAEKFTNLEITLKKDIQSMEYRLVIKLGVFFVVAMSMALAIARSF